MESGHSVKIMPSKKYGIGEDDDEEEEYAKWKPTHNVCNGMYLVTSLRLPPCVAAPRAFCARLSEEQYFRKEVKMEQKIIHIPQHFGTYTLTHSAIFMQKTSIICCVLSFSPLCSFCFCILLIPFLDVGALISVPAQLLIFRIVDCRSAYMNVNERMNVTAKSGYGPLHEE